jgi:hypothetical protein
VIGGRSRRGQRTVLDRGRRECRRESDGRWSKHFRSTQLCVGGDGRVDGKLALG